MFRSKNSRGDKLRAPQYSIGAKSDKESDRNAQHRSELEELFAPGPSEQAPPPTVVVRRKRRVGLPAGEAGDASASATQAGARDGDEERRPRVFVVPHHEAEAPELEEAEAPAAPAKVRRTSKRTLEAQKPGEVVVTRPELPAPEDTESLPELEAKFQEAVRTLEEIDRGTRSWSFDLTINERWSQVDDALQHLHATLPPRLRR